MYKKARKLTTTLLKNSCDTESLKETQKMDMLERLLYRQGQHCKAGTRDPHMLEVCLEKINFCQNSEANDNVQVWMPG